MTQLVKLKKRPSRDRSSFSYCLDYKDEHGKRVRQSLGHKDQRKAEQQRAQRERELRMGVVAPGSLKIKDFLKDSLQRTRGQVSPGTLTQYGIAMNRFIEAIGNIDIQRVEHQHGERFIQACLDRGNAPATVNKNLRAVKRLFELAVLRGQLEKNPLRRVQNPRVPRTQIRIYSDQECVNIIKAAEAFDGKAVNHWNVLVLTALCTGMRRGELLNSVWSDVDFEKKVINLSPKKETELTWEWNIKDHERRTLPLTDEVLLTFEELT